MSVELAKGERDLAVGDRVWAKYFGTWWADVVVGFTGRRVLVMSAVGSSAKALRRKHVVRRAE